jgi:hypothetical protein
MAVAVFRLGLFTDWGSLLHGFSGSCSSSEASSSQFTGEGDSGLEEFFCSLIESVSSSESEKRSYFFWGFLLRFGVALETAEESELGEEGVSVLVFESLVPVECWLMILSSGSSESEEEK